MRLPDPLFARLFLRRAVFIWFGTRILFGVAGVLVAEVFGPPSIFISPSTAIMLSCLVGVLGVLDARRRNEHLLLADLGVSQWPIWMISALPALMAESLIALAALR